MTIRPERPEEFPAIHRLAEEAFRTAKVSDGKERDFTDRLRAAGGYIPSPALVAEEEGRLIGRTMLTRTTLRDGTPVLLLAPLSVVLDCRSRGIGAALVREALRKACGREEQAVVLVGDPAYYGRFGFRRSTEPGIRNTNGIPDEYVQVLELVPGALAGTHTTIAFEEP